MFQLVTMPLNLQYNGCEILNNSQSFEADMANMFVIDGRTVRIMREDFGWPQEELAKRAGCSRAYINKIENGHKKNVSMKVAGGIAAAFGVRIEQLTGLEEYQENNHVETEELRLDDLPEWSNELLKLGAELSEIKRQELLQIGQILLASQNETTARADNVGSFLAALKIIEDKWGPKGLTDCLNELSTATTSLQRQFILARWLRKR